MNDAIRIVYAHDADDVIWEKDTWDDYMYDGRNFIVKKNGNWVGIYPMNRILSIEVR